MSQRLLVLGVWLVVASGPLVGGIALLRTMAAPPQTVDPPAPAHVLGFAEVVVASHLAGGAQGHPRLRPALAPAPPRPSAGAASAVDEPWVDRPAIAAIGSRPAGPRRWGVTVAAVGGDGAVEAWQVTIADRGDGPSAEIAPALVALPPLPATPRPQPGQPLAVDDPRAVAVTGFLRSWYLTHEDLDRWVRPGSPLLADGGQALPARVDAATPARLTATVLDAQHQVVLAEVWLRRDGRTRVTHLPLLLVGAAGRWEIAATLPALPSRTAPAAADDHTGPSSPAGPAETGRASAVAPAEARHDPAGGDDATTSAG